MRRRLLMLLATVASIPIVAAPASAPAASVTPVGFGSKPVALTRLPCFGAAARDPARQPCRQPELRLAVIPDPPSALLQAVPCRVVEAHDALRVCALGVSARRPRRTVALIGDSHAEHLNAAVDKVAHLRHWRAYAMSFPGCALSTVFRAYDIKYEEGCARFRDSVLAWLGRHPEVNTVLETAYASDEPPVVLPPGENIFAGEARGFAEMWQSLPATVKHVVAIRDVPQAPVDSADCIGRALAQRLPPGTACAYDRARFLPPDPAATAVRALNAPRYRFVDLTRFMCGSRQCFPVIGGALVHMDTNHLTPQFAATLGPYLSAALVRVLR